MVTFVRRHPWWITSGAVLAGLGILALALRNGEGESRAAPSSARPPVPVVVAEASRGEFVDRIEAIGTARSNESVVITSRVTDTVREINFSDGMEVKAGAILAELTGDEEMAQLAEARSDYEDAARNQRRIARLHAQRTVSGSQLDAAVAARDSARARVDAIEARLDDLLIRAPFAGVLGLRAVSPGALVQPGDTITTLDDLSVIKLDFAVPETDLASLEPGLEIVARSAAWRDREFRGTVRTVDSRVDPVTRAITVRAEIPNPERLLRPGMLLTLELIRTRADALTIPEEALVPVQDRHFVLVVNAENEVERRPVEPGRRRPGAVEVRTGLAPGERVIVEGTNRVRPGHRVEVVEAR